MPGGRPSKLPPTVVARLTEAIRQGAPCGIACKFAGISYQTFNEWWKQGDGKFREFSDAIKEAEGEAAVKWLSHMEESAKARVGR